MTKATILARTNDVSRLVRDLWGLEVHSIAGLDRGSAICRIVETDRGRVFLKEFPRGVSRQRVDREMKILMHLRGDGVAVAEVIPTCKGEGTALYQGRVFQLQTFIEGARYEKFEAPEWLNYMLPKALASIICSLARYPRLPNDYDAWFKRDLRARIRSFRDIADRSGKAVWLSAENRERLSENARKRVELINIISRNNLENIPFTFGNTHGDYSILQVICDNSSIHAVIDFVRASYMPLVWDVFRSFSYLDKNCKEGGIEPSALRSYVAEFEEVLPLSDVDKAHMVDLYAYQLAPSTMGFRQALDPDSYEDGQLIDFACWRTKMCETLITRRAEIFDMLQS